MMVPIRIKSKRLVMTYPPYDASTGLRVLPSQTTAARFPRQAPLRTISSRQDQAAADRRRARESDRPHEKEERAGEVAVRPAATARIGKAGGPHPHEREPRRAYNCERC